MRRSTYREVVERPGAPLHRRRVMLMGLGLTLGVLPLRGAQGLPGPAQPAVAVTDFSRDRTLFDSGLAQGLNSAAIPLSGTTDAPDGAAILAELVDAASGAVVHPAQAVATAAGGAWAGSYVGAARNPGWLKPRVWVAGSTAAKATTVNRLGVGFVYVVSGQSNEQYWLRGGQANMTGAFDAILDPEAVQILSLQNRGTPTESDAGATVAGPDFVTNANRISEGVSATAAMWNRVAPGLKVMIVVDAKGGIGQNHTLDDVAPPDLRMFSKARALFDAMRADGGEAGAFLVMHPNGIATTTWQHFASYLKEAFTGRRFYSSGTTVAPGSGGPQITAFPTTLGIQADPADHIWPELLPGIAAGKTKLFAMISGWTHVRSNVSGAEPAAPEVQRQAMEWLGNNVPEFTWIGGSETSYLGDAAQNFTNDGTHFSGGLDDGTKNHGRMLAALPAQALGLTGTTLPRIDQIAWAADGVTLGWSGGPITTRRAFRNPGSHPTYRATGSMVLGFYDENFQMLRASIVDANGNRADKGAIRLVPNGAAFTGTSKVYYDWPLEPGGQVEFMQNGGPDFLALGDQGVGEPFIGLQLQLPASDANFINALNSLPQDPGVPATSLVPGIANGGTQRATANMASGQTKLTLELLGARTSATDGNFEITRDSGGSATYWRFYVNSLGSSPTIRFAFANASSGGTRFDGTAVFPAGYLNAANGLMPRTRIVVDTVAGYVRLFVTPAGGTEVEITSTSLGPASSATGNPFGDSAAGVQSPGGAFRTGVGLSFGRYGTYTVAHWRVWRAVQADGSAPAASPWAEAVADGTGGFTTAGLS